VLFWHVPQRGRERHVVVDLVDVEATVGPLLRFAGGARERGLPDARDDEAAEQLAGVLAERALRQPHEQQAPWSRQRGMSSVVRG
jgi:hypothetical protein